MRLIIEKYVYDRFKGRYKDPLSRVCVAIVDPMIMDLLKTAGTGVHRVARPGDYYIEVGPDSELVRIDDQGNAKRIWPTSAERDGL
jgi:hypothetical protein